jgi:NAD(P)-dependent dehydrogenase (short-subunit alcohol dehydrogenase family)
MLARGGAEVVLAVRDEARGHAAAASMGGSTEVRRLDVSDLASVREFVAGVGDVDVLVNNAGVMAVPHTRTADGFELQMATNHLGHFALTLGLLPRIADRVVVVSSRSHRHAQLDPEDLNNEGTAYDAYGAYASSKLANLLFLAELQRRLTASGSTVRAMGAHPGYSSTKITRSTGDVAFNALATLGNGLVGMPASQGALSILAAAVLDVPGNTYFGPDGPGELRGMPVPVGRSAAAGDPDLAKAVWSQSARLTGVDWP